MDSDAAPPADASPPAPAQAHDDPLLSHGNGSGERPVIGSAHIRPIFLGNLDFGVTTDEIADLFARPALDMPPMSIDRVDLKRGFAFVFLNDAKSEDEKERVGRYVDGINGMEFPKISKSIRSEFARGDGRIKRKEDDRRKDIQPNETLFVVNFSEETTKREDLEMLFSPYGELVRIDMKKNYAFVQFTSVNDAIKAKDATNGGKLDQSVITVEFVAAKRRDRDGGGYRGRGGDRDGDRDRGGYRGRRDYRGRGRDDDRDRYDDRYDSRRRSPPRYDDRRGRSRSRSPMYRRSRSRSPGFRRGGRDEYRGGRGRHDSYDRNSNNNNRDGGYGGRDRDARGYR